MKTYLKFLEENNYATQMVRTELRQGLKTIEEYEESRGIKKQKEKARRRINIQK